MTNLEKYLNEILRSTGSAFGVIKTKTGNCNIKNCDEIACTSCILHGPCGSYCNNNRYKWLAEEYKEPEIDWSIIPVDTKVYVRNEDEQPWKPRYFSHYDSVNNLLYTFAEGATSWSVIDKNYIIHWKQAKLAEEDKES